MHCCLTVFCSAGTHKNGDECVECEVGFYQPYAMQTSCIKCPVPYTTKSTGTVSRTDCVFDGECLLAWLFKLFTSFT